MTAPTTMLPLPTYTQEERRALVARLRGEGRTLSYIAAVTGVTIRTVSKDSKALGLGASTSGGWLDAAPLLHVLDLHGVTFASLGPALRQALHRAARSGRISRHMADEVCVRALAEHPVAVFGPAWWDDSTPAAPTGRGRAA